MFDKLHGKRLTMLADHLEEGELGHYYFDFGVWNTSREPNICGTAGCAVGECPILFPSDWKFGVFGKPFLINGEQIEPLWDSQQFFGLERDEAFHLFSPGNQNTAMGGKHLDDKATRYDVAANIRAFLEYKARETA